MLVLGVFIEVLRLAVKPRQAFTGDIHLGDAFFQPFDVFVQGGELFGGIPGFLIPIL
jgi:hypothetical protein